MSTNDLQKVFILSRNFSRDDNDVDLFLPGDERRKIMKRAHQRSSSDPLNPGSLNNLRKKALHSSGTLNADGVLNNKEEEDATEAKEEVVELALSSASDHSDRESQRAMPRTASIGRAQLMATIMNSSVRSIQLDESDSEVEENDEVGVYEDRNASPPIDPIISLMSLSTDSKQVSFGSKGLSPLTQFLAREDTPQDASMLGSAMPSRDVDMEACLSLFQRMSSSDSNMVMMSSEDVHLPERGIFLRDQMAFSRSFSGQHRVGVAQIATHSEDLTSQDLLSLFSHSNSGTNWQVHDDYGVACTQPYAPPMPPTSHAGMVHSGNPAPQGYGPEMPAPPTGYAPSMLPPVYPVMPGPGPALDLRDPSAMAYPPSQPPTAYPYPLPSTLPPLYSQHRPRQPSEDDSANPQNYRMMHSFGQMQLGLGAPPLSPATAAAAASSTMPPHVMHYMHVSGEGLGPVGGSNTVMMRAPMNPDRASGPGLLSNFIPMDGVAAIPFMSDTRDGAGAAVSSSSSTNSGSASESAKLKKATDKNNRGNYHCGRCGMLKANHVCPYSDAPPSACKETQTALMVLRGTSPWEGLHSERFITVTKRSSL